ncbi:MAG: hypothetical protein PHE25_03155 [Candidatus Gracilibacteria bacterium]|nr:hypothetical protein [Candidatus Gracilibacteria bacterium]
MNVLLEKMLLNNFLDDKDRYEIRQIFNIVDDEKKQNILKNFDKMIQAIIKVKEELREQQEILLGKAISNIETAIKNARNSGIKKASKYSISQLKQII